MLRTIHLHGVLGSQFGETFRLDVRSPAEAIRALTTQMLGLQRAIAEGTYRIVIGKSANRGRTIGIPAKKITDDAPIRDHCAAMARDLNAPWRAGEEDMHVIPVVRGRKGGTGKIIIGVIIMAVAVVAAIPSGGGSIALGTVAIEGLGITYGMIAAAGAMVALGGLAMAMSPQPKTTSYGERESPDQRASYLFNSIVNTMEQGGVVPLIYGKTMVGSQVIGMGLSPQDIPYEAAPSTSTPSLTDTMLKL